MADANAGPEPDILDTPAAGDAVVRGGALRFAGFAAGTALSVVGIGLITRLLGTADFGRFQTVLSLITVVGAVTDAGMSTLGVREYTTLAGRERDALMRTLLGLRLALTLTGTIVAFGAAVAMGYRGELLLGTVLAGIGLALTVLQTTYQIPLAAQLRNGVLAGIDLARQALTVAGYAVCALLGAGVAGYLAVPIPVGAALVVVVVLLVRTAMPLRPSVDVRLWGRLLRPAIAFAVATAVGTIYVYTAQILTAAVADADAAGLFGAAFRVFIVVGSVAGLLVTVAFPVLARAARDDGERFAYALGRVTETTWLLGLGAALVTIVSAPDVIAIIAGGEFEGAVAPLQIMAVTLLASYLVAPLGFALLSLHRHRGLLLANATAFAVSVVVVALLASAHGASGAAVGTAIGEWTLAAGYFVALRAAGKVPPIRARMTIPGALVAGAVAALCVTLPVTPLLAATVAGALYGAVLLLLRAVPDELMSLMPWRG